MRIRLTSVYVDDQEKALAFYTGRLGFVVKHDIPMGEARWLTVVSPEEPEHAELLLEPNGNPIAQRYQQALREQGIPIASFEVDDAEDAYERLRARGVEFTTAPTPMGTATIAVLDDTCGNLVQIYAT